MELQQLAIWQMTNVGSRGDDISLLCIGAARRVRWRRRRRGSALRTDPDCQFACVILSNTNVRTGVGNGAHCIYVATEAAIKIKGW